MKYIKWSLLIVFLTALYFNIGYICANAATSVLKPDCVSQTILQKFFSINGLICEKMPVDEISFATFIILWPIMFIISLLGWICKLTWYYIFAGGIVKLLGLV